MSPRRPAPQAVQNLSVADYNAQVDASMSEEVWQAQILGEALRNGWLRCHIRPARVLKWVKGRGQIETYRTPVEGDGEGFPDDVLLRPPRMVVIEAKSAKGHLGPLQPRWLDAFQQCGAEVYVLRPADRAGLSDILGHHPRPDLFWRIRPEKIAKS